MRPGSGRIHDRLPGFTGRRTYAAGRHHRHVAGVKIRAEILHLGRASHRRRSTCGERGGAGRIDIEGAVFLDDPPIIGDERALGRVLDRDRQPAGSLENQRGRCAIAGPVLRVLGRVLKAVTGRADRRPGRTGTAGSRRHCGKGTIGVQRHSQSRVRSERVDAQGVAGRVPVVRQYAGRADLQEGGNVAGVGVRIGGGRCAQGGAAGGAGVALRDRGGGRCARQAIDQVAEGAAAGGREGRGRVAEGSVGLEGQGGQAALQGDRTDAGAIGAHIIGEHTLALIRHDEGHARDAIVGLADRRRDHWRERSGTRGIRADIGLHAAIAHIVGGQAQLPIEDGQHRRRSGTGHGRVDQHVIGLAGGHEHFALNLRISGQHIAVFRDERKAGGPGESSLRAHD